jgi:CHAT domain-containing protein/Tfp pilus assembly protein PilF
VLKRQPGKDYVLSHADALMNLATLYQVQGEMARSEALVTQSLQMKERHFGPRHYEVARTLNNLATLYTDMGLYQKALEAHARALAILEQTFGPDHPDVGRSLLNQAGVLTLTKDFDAALPVFERALKIREASLGVDHPDVAKTLHNLAGLHVETRRFDEALATYERALAIYRARLGDRHPETAGTLMAIGRLHLLQDRFEPAETFLRQSLDIYLAASPPTDPKRSYNHQYLAVVLSQTGRADEAVAQFDLARRGFRRYADQVLPALAEAEQLTYLETIDEPAFHEALSLARPRFADPQTAALTAGWVINGKALVQQTLAQRALLARDSTNPAAAQVVALLQRLRKQLASLSLVEDESADDAARRQKMDDLARQEQEEARRLARLSGRSDGTSEWVELDSVRSHLPEDSLLIEIARFSLHDPSADTQEPWPERYVAWIVAADAAEPVHVVDLGDAAEIDGLVQASRQALHEGLSKIREEGEPDVEAALRQMLRQLAEKVLDPLLPYLSDRRMAYLSPDSVLWIVPWAALPLDDGAYAIERFDLRFVVTGRDLVSEPATFDLSRPIMIADPNYDLSPQEVQTATQTLFKQRTPAGAVRATAAGSLKLGSAGRLPGTKAEAAAVRPLLESYAGNPAILYSDQYALEAVFKVLRQPKVMVISTHGFFQSDEADAGQVRNPLIRCGLLLAGCNQPAVASGGAGEDGILTGMEIIGTDLRGTELVVLSACETGLGEVRNGEGVSGLRQAFQLAGARTVISTLWQIPDRETAQLMTAFFEDLAASRDPGASLRNAQLRMIEARRERHGAAHPFFWAAFTLTGR